LGRTGLGIEGYEDFIQVDAAINPGNSGGALVNLRGELVGINTAIAGPTGGNVGIGFAIPIDMAMQVALQLVENGRVERGQIGIMIQDLDPDLAEAFGVADTGGVLIADIVPGSPAEVAGLKPGDIVVAVDNDSVDDAAELRLAVSFKQPGATVRLGLIREGRPQSMRVTLGRAVGSQVEANRGGPSVPATGRLDGATLRSVPADEGSGGRRSGVLVEDLDAASPLSAAGVRPGDVIVEAGGKPVHSPQELDRRARQSDGPLILRIYRAGRAYFTTIG
jgi:S1-C subfamily serine protease